MIADDAVQVPSFSGYSGATLHLAIDPAEHQRRQAAGIGPVTGHGFGGLDHLMALPAGMPVPLDSLTKEQQKYVRRAPNAIVTVKDGKVTRHAIRPCRVAMATVRYDTTYKMALDSASRFAPFCARQVIVKRLPKDAFARINDLAEFDFYGIGIILEKPDGSLETVVEPRPWIPKRHTPAGWWFAERAYATYLEHALTDTTGVAQ
ncbi:hypothetical protein ACFV4E_22805 [Streptomyces hygroscopicus]|uniref:Uncharacterized protein n=1 Tax=Streptomyces hygroscopicus TaxID=1912 RepID=A0ABQ3UFB3_STRHY|nr:hypothetical protein [Streptomyces hygroscopicus]GHJ34299.1 hypothetical protein TPA0910_87320 [Streptomyces hygroscopicus]